MHKKYPQLKGYNYWLSVGLKQEVKDRKQHIKNLGKKFRSKKSKGYGYDLFVK